jgi:hypothetical protein
LSHSLFWFILVFVKKTKNHSYFHILADLFILVEVIFIFPTANRKTGPRNYGSMLANKKRRASGTENGGSSSWWSLSVVLGILNLHAEKARGYQQEGDYFLDKVKVQFYNLDAKRFYGDWQRR